MKKNLIFVLTVYLMLTLLTGAVMQDISPRHTVFFVVDGILLLIGRRLMQDTHGYYRATLLLLGMLCSVFIIRYLTPTVIKVWEVDNYISFVFAISNLFWLAVAIWPFLRGRQLAAGLLGGVLFVPLLICWGYYFSENAWLNVEAIMALMESNPAEAQEYLLDRTGWSGAVCLLAYTLMIASLVFAARRVIIKRGSWNIYAGAIVFLVLNVVLLLRTSDNFVTSIYDETKDYQANYEEFAHAKEVRQDMASKLHFESVGEPGIYVLVIGESQNRTRMSAYGYSSPTTPWLESMKGDHRLILFNHAYSCHVQTVPSLTYALTAKNQYNTVPLEEAVSLLEVVKAAGFDTVWLSNQVRYGSWGTPISVIADSAEQQTWINSHAGNTLDTDFYDGELLKRLDDVKFTDKMLIVIHFMGNHISYHSRYPSEFEKFREDRKNSEYDNSILYNDYVMKNMLAKFQNMPNFKGMIYFADHSEAVNIGQSHNPATFDFDMAYIPFYMYFQNEYIQDNQAKIDRLRAATDEIFTNDLIFNTVLSVMGIKVNGIYEPKNDIASPSYDNNANRFLTLYGEKRIADDLIK